MFRSTVRWGLVLGLSVAACLVWSTAGPVNADKKPKAEKALEKGAAKPKEPSPSLEKLLARRVELSKGIEKNTPLKDALEFMSDEFNLTIIIDMRAFEAIGVANVEGAQVQLPKIKGFPLGTVLRLLLSQVGNESGHAGTYLVRRDFVEITTTLQARADIFGENYSGRHVPWVSVRFDRRPLDQALEELSELISVNIVLDARSKDQAKTEVTARLLNTPVDTAVRVLADMADLKPVALDNVLYVTTKENAKELEDELARRSPPPKPEVKKEPEKTKDTPKK